MQKKKKNVVEKNFAFYFIIFLYYLIFYNKIVLKQIYTKYKI